MLTLSHHCSWDGKTDSIHHHHPEGAVYRNCCLNSSTVAVSKVTSRRWWCIESVFPANAGAGMASRGQRCRLRRQPLRLTFYPPGCRRTRCRHCQPISATVDRAAKVGVSLNMQDRDGERAEKHRVKRIYQDNTSLIRTRVYNHVSKPTAYVGTSKFM